MSYGLEIRDASGNLTLSNDDLGLRYVTVQRLTGSSGSISAPGCNNANSYVYIVNTSGMDSHDPGDQFGPAINISIGNQVVNWSSNRNLSSFVVYATIFRHK